MGDVRGFGLAAAAAAAGSVWPPCRPLADTPMAPCPFAARMLALSAVATVALAPWLTP